jgi:hypothetical protein
VLTQGGGGEMKCPCVGEPFISKDKSGGLCRLSTNEVMHHTTHARPFLSRLIVAQSFSEVGSMDIPVIGSVLGIASPVGQPNLLYSVCYGKEGASLSLSDVIVTPPLEIYYILFSTYFRYPHTGRLFCKVACWR